jgi:hypothetical protein
MYKKELYAAYFSVKKCTALLGMCQSVILRTDCKAVSGLLSQKPNPMIARWLTMFLDLDIRWEFIKGSENTFADLLSRHVFASDDGGPLPPAPDEPPAPAISSETFGNLGRRITTSNTGQTGSNLENDITESDDHILTCAALYEGPSSSPSMPATQSTDGEPNREQESDNLSPEAMGMTNGVDAPDIEGHLRNLSMTQDDIKEWQRFDTWTEPIVAYRTKGVLPDSEALRRDILLHAETYTVDSVTGLLYRINTPREKSQAVLYQLCVPAIMKAEVLKLYHNNPIFGGHLSIRKAFYKLSRNFFWPGYHDDLEGHIRKCVICQKRRVPAHAALPPLRPFRVSNLFEMVSVDHIGPLSTIKSKPNHNFNYIIVFVEYLTRYVVAVPAVSCGAEETADLPARNCLQVWLM